MGQTNKNENQTGLVSFKTTVARIETDGTNCAVIIQMETRIRDKHRLQVLMSRMLTAMAREEMTVELMEDAEVKQYMGGLPRDKWKEIKK